MQIDHLDHLVLTVRHMQATIDFFTRVIGMQLVTFGRGRQALAFGSQKKSTFTNTSMSLKV